MSEQPQRCGHANVPEWSATRILLRCVRLLLAQSGGSPRRSNSVAFGGTADIQHALGACRSDATTLAVKILKLRACRECRHQKFSNSVPPPRDSQVREKPATWLGVDYFKCMAL